MPSPQLNKGAPASSAEHDSSSDGKGKEQIGQWNRRSTGVTIQMHQLAGDNSQPSFLHLAPSASSSSILNPQPTRLFPVLSIHKQQHPIAQGINPASLGWVQNESQVTKKEDTQLSKKSTVSVPVQEESQNTDCGLKKASRDGQGKGSTELASPVIHGDGCMFSSCEKTFEDDRHFLRHLYSDHHLYDKSTMQCLVQREVVHSLEEQLAVEKQRLLEMRNLISGKLGTTHLSKHREPGLLFPQPHHPGVSPWPGLDLSVPLQEGYPDTELALRRQPWGSSSVNIFQNKTNCIDYYQTNNIRPPFTYASLIRWAILESPQKQLALNEIYQWFTKMFAFFRNNKVTWKNAVRHNLSLHKCFVRVENLKGAVWMVDEQEFHRKRGMHPSH